MSVHYQVYHVAHTLFGERVVQSDISRATFYDAKLFRAASIHDSVVWRHRLSHSFGALESFIMEHQHTYNNRLVNTMAVGMSITRRPCYT